MQGVFLHGGNDGLAFRMDNDACVAAFPLQLARRVGLGGDKPERGTVVVGGTDALALAVEDQAGDGGGMSEFLQHLARLVEQADDLAGAGGNQPPALVAPSWVNRIGGDVLHPFHAEVADDGDGAVGTDAVQLAVVTAGDESVAGRIHSKAEDRAIMGGNGTPIFAGCQANRAIAKGEAGSATVTGEAGRNNEGIKVAGDAAGFQQVGGFSRLTHASGFRSGAGPVRPPRLECAAPQVVDGRFKPGHRGRWRPQSATQLSKPRRSCGRFRLRPMNTRRLVFGSPSFDGRMKSPSAIMCTAWKAKRRSSLA